MSVDWDALVAHAARNTRLLPGDVIAGRWTRCDGRGSGPGRRRASSPSTEIGIPAEIVIVDALISQR